MDNPHAVAIRERTRHASVRAPVFVLGAPRSGTTLLYHMLLSAGGFAVFRAETHVFDLLGPRFGDFGKLRNRQRLLEQWLESKSFEVSGLDAARVKDLVLNQCHGWGDFLRKIMEEIARDQQVERWAECTPDHLLYLPEIKEEIHDALIIHIIRDGRDVAVSAAKQGWFHPFPWDRHREVLVAGMYWEWVVNQGRRFGSYLGSDYREVRFEQLLVNPSETLASLGRFIGHDLDYERIRKVGIGSVTNPNTSFEPGREGEGFAPIGRWQEQLGDEDQAALEYLLADTLTALEYPLSGGSGKTNESELRRMKAIYLRWFETKQWLKMHSALGRRLVNTEIV
jgi:Sulfotransferase family